MDIQFNDKELEINIDHLKDFDAEQIFTCGQCFRWIALCDNYYRGVVGKQVIDVEQVTDSSIIIRGVTQSFFENTLYHYFDFETDYSKIKKTLAKDDAVLKKAIRHGAGIRILNQSIFETLISFIISGNNNIPRIMKAIDSLSKSYGTYIKTIEGVEYYSFPTPEDLSEVSVETFRTHGLGYRDKYVYSVVQDLLAQKNKLEELTRLDNKKLKEGLITFKGVGSKVADCIILFAFSRKSAFPVDTWVKKIMKAYYMNEDTKDKEILTFAENKFGQYAGIAQQYLFYYSRSMKL